MELRETDPEGLTDASLIDRLDNAALIDRFETSDDWRLVREACKRAKEKARDALARADPKDTELIIELQKIAAIYGDFIPSLIRSFRDDGVLAFEESKNRGILSRVFKTS